MKLDRCEGCGGFVPSSLAACPHCRSARVRIGAIATLVASTTIAFTLMACYGGPPPPANSTPPDTTPTSPDGGK